MTGPIRVLLVDDDPLVLSGLKMMLAGARNIEVVSEAHDGHGVLPAADLHHPDVVLMDIRMPRLDGIAATRLLRAQPASGHRPDHLRRRRTGVARAAGRGRPGSCSRTPRPPTSSPRSKPCTPATARSRPR